jgi:hypothetical protein
VAGAKVDRRVVKSSTGASAASGGVGCSIGSAVAIAAIGGGPEMIACRSACVGSPPDLAAASGASCPDEATVPARTDGSPSIATSWSDKNARMPRVNTIPAATKLRTTTGRLRDSVSRWRAAS